MREVELNKMVGEYLGLANFYMELNEVGVPRWKYMDRNRMIYIFKVCMNNLESENAISKIEGILILIKRGVD